MIKKYSVFDCNGCHACSNVCPKQCISMKSNEEGFYYPCIDASLCIDCGLCGKSCPIINNNDNRKTEKNIKAYAAYTNNLDIRLKSSSGGLFTEIASYVINNGGIVFGATLNDKLLVEHIAVETIEDLSKLRGSKYIQSIIGNTYKEAKMNLDNNRLVLFTGTPCQISGLYSYLKKDYDNLITQDIVCHGVPSPMVWKQYLKYIENKTGSTPINVSFRDKRHGWESYSIVVNLENGEEYIELGKDNMYMKAFLSDYCLRPSCYNCKFKSKVRTRDFTLADFWGINNILPQFNDQKGTSLVLVNSDKANKIFKSIDSEITLQSIDLNLALQYNPSSYKSATMPKKRQAFVKDIKSMPFDKVIKKYTKPSKIRKLLSRVKNKLIRILNH